MIKRLLLACLLWYMVATCSLQEANGQTAQTQSAGAEASVPTPSQEARPQPTPTSSTNKPKPPISTATADQSSTVGDPASSGSLNVKGKLRYFAVESFRPGIYPVAAFYDGLTMANPPKAYPPEWRQGFPGFARNAYLPDPYANPSHGLSRSALALTGFITSNLADEFRPEIHKVARKLHVPFMSK